MTLKGLLRRDGYVFLREYMKNSTAEEFLRYFKENEGLEQASDIHKLVPAKMKDSTPNTYSGQYGYNDFPMHTDLAHWARPPRYILLRCIKGCSSVSTKLLDGNELVSDLGVRRLERTLVKPRRPINEKVSLMRVFQSGTPSLFRWDDAFIVPASPAGKAGVTSIKLKIEELDKKHVYLHQLADTLVLDNWRMLHGRSKILDGFDDRIFINKNEYDAAEYYAPEEDWSEYEDDNNEPF